MKEYQRKIHYYETDKMGVAHHSNYIRWFEESRVDLLDQSGFGFARLEEMGILSPVLGVRANYKKMLRFGETITVVPSVVRFTGIKFTLSYEVKNQAGELCCTGETDHCFLGVDGKPMRLKDRFPEVYAFMQNLANKGE